MKMNFLFFFAFFLSLCIFTVKVRWSSGWPQVIRLLNNNDNNDKKKNKDTRHKKKDKKVDGEDDDE